MAQNLMARLSVPNQTSLFAGVMLALGSCNMALAGQQTVEAPVLAPGPVPRSTAPAQPAPPSRETIALFGTARQGGILKGLLPPGASALTLDGAPLPIAPDGQFIVAFDRDAAASALLRATLADGSVIDRRLDVAPGNWRIEHVNASPTGGAASSAEFIARRTGELAQINDARAIATASAGWRQDFIWPVKARVSGLFGAQRVYRGQPGSYHSGMDIAGGHGTVYVAPADGVVTLAAVDPFTLEGKLLMIDHGMGLNSAFLHSSDLLVKAGDVVKQGQPIGRIGASGRASGPHLHWGMKWRAARIDPLPMLPPQ